MSDTENASENASAAAEAVGEQAPQTETAADESKADENAAADPVPTVDDPLGLGPAPDESQSAHDILHEVERRLVQLGHAAESELFILLNKVHSLL